MQNKNIDLNPFNMLNVFRVDSEKIKRHFIRPTKDFEEFKIEAINQSIISRFERSVQQYPERIAVNSRHSTGNPVYTYKELNEISNSIAHALCQAYGMKKVGIGILFEHGAEMIAAMLGVLKSGNFYIPLDPTYPLNRLEYMLKDSDAKVALTNDRNLDFAKKLVGDSSRIRLMNIHDIPRKGIDGFRENPRLKIGPSDAAYILYTSGSTGTPKGVVQCHRNVLHFMQVYTHNLHINYDDRLTLFSSYGFDAAVMDIYGALLNGAAVYPYNIKEVGKVEEMADWLRQEEITIYHSVPTVFRFFTEGLSAQDQFPSVRLIVLGGEEVLKKDTLKYKAHFPDHCLFINGLGPTESTVTLQNIMDKQTEIRKELVPVGFPVDRTHVYLLDENDKEVDTLGVGEIIYASDYLALGYLNKPEKTADAFGINPIKNKGRVYRSGDFGKRLPDGSIEFIGRRDSQVKIRGYRVELSEIEGVMDNISGIKKSVITCLKPENEDNFLVGYYVKNKEIEESEIKEALRAALPDYMVPRVLVKIDAFPLTPTGKIDRKALPEPEISQLSAQFIEPRSDIERKLAEIWMEVFGFTSPISIEANFFELGGHSLRATVMASRIHKELHAQVLLTDIFKYPTIRELAKYIQGIEEEVYESIQPAEEKEYYELSSVQKRLYVLQQMNAESTAYNITVTIPLPQEVDITKLESAFQALIKRHESLRTSFHSVDGLLIQRVHEDVEFRINQFLTEFTGDTEGKGREFKHFIRYFDLAKAPLMRVGLFGNEGGTRVLLVDLHHIITDGTSQEVLKQDFMKLYHGEELPLLRIQYKDFVAWQYKDKEKEKGVLEQQEVYWLNEFEGEIPVLTIPTDYPRPAVQRVEGNHLNFRIDSEMTRLVMTYLHKEEITLNMMVLAVVNILLSKLSGQEDIVIGTPVAGRRHADLEKVIGMFVNTLALRNYPVGEKRFEEFLYELKEKTLNAFDNQEYPFEDLVEQVVTHRDLSRNPLFDVMFVVQNINRLEIDGFGNDREIGDSSVNKSASFSGPLNAVSKFDLTIMVWEKKESLQVAFKYSTKLFKEETIKRFITYFNQILIRVVDEPRIRIHDIEIISKEEREHILYNFNSTTHIKYPKDTLHHLFDVQAKQMPDNVIVIGGEKKLIQLTYRELNHRADSISALLRRKEINAGSIIGIMVRPSVEMMIGIVGILKAGCAFLPIEPEAPADRIGYILNDSHMPILLTQSNFIDQLSTQTQMIPIDNPDAYKDQCQDQDIGDVGDVGNIGLPVDPAYVIYTSGTTGRPKGVLISHQNLVNYIHWFIQTIDLTIDDKAILTSSFAFDALYTQLFSSLWIGSPLHVIPRETFLIAEKLLHYLRDHHITYIKVTPSLFNLIVNSPEFRAENLKRLRFVMLGGEEINVNDVEKAHHLCSHLQIMNHYGPTETTIGSIARFLDLDQFDDYKKTPTIGKPLYNTQVYILDRSFHIVPVGVVGGLFIGGNGVGMGYLNKPQLTSDKFITGLWGSHTRVYATGDLARWAADGHIVFLGRSDDQIKIRGYRIELGEIENHLLKYPDINEAVVLVREKKNREKYLCAYVIAEKPIEISELRQSLSRSLPAAMIPSYFIQLEKMPLTKHNKLNREALPEPEFNAEEHYVAPRDEIERALTRIWSEVLNLAEDKIGIDDHFFELGGHSLKATVMVSRIHKALDVQVPLADIFKRSTIRELGEYVRGIEKEKYESIHPVEEKEYYELSSAQKRLYILQQMDRETTAYNMPTIIHLSEDVDIDQLERTFKKLIKRHESLRSSFHMINDGLIQRVHDDVEFEILHFLTALTEDTEGKGRGFKHFIRYFDLAKAPLIRVGVFNREEGTPFLLVDMHHMITDGISQAVLRHDFMRLFNGEALSPLRIQYKDFAEWQNRNKAKEKLNPQEAYWLRAFEGEIPVLTIPIDYPRPAIQNFEGNKIHFEINNCEGFAPYALNQGVTLYMMILAIINMLLSKLSGQEDIVIGTPVAGRRHADLESVIGMFVNTLALRNFPAGNKRFGEFLSELKERTLEAFENQEYPFEDLVDHVVIHRDMSRNPLFDVMFTFQNMGRLQADWDDTLNAVPSVRAVRNKINPVSKFDLEITIWEQGNGLSGTFGYCTKLFKEETIKRFIVYFKHVITGIIDNQDIKIGDIQMITEEEKKHLLYDFNDTKKDYPNDKTLHELFEEQVERTPDRIAIIGPSVRLTYKELNERSNRVGWLLRDQGIGPNAIVGLMIERSIDMMIGILGIIKAGAAYLPIDPDYPAERVRYMLKDSESSLLLSEMDDSHGNNQNLKITANSQDLIYMIYTSGSTGNPKGVMVKNDGFLNLLYWYIDAFNINENDNILLIAPISFDLAQKNLFGWFIVGGCLTLAPSGLPDYDKLSELINNEQTTLVNCAPSVFYPLIDLNRDSDFRYLKSLRRVVLGGEPISIDKLLPWIHSEFYQAEIANTYGPTECTDIASCYPIPNEGIENLKSIPIGKPVSNVAIYILGQYHEVLPVGVGGELYIGGIGVSGGYYNNKPLTEEKFLEISHLPEAKVYRTGDMAQWLDDGNIEFLGRIDDQVKVNGVRIELGEIEHALLSHDAIRDAVVMIRKREKGDSYLCAYIISDQQVSVTELGEYLSTRLPQYMIPAYWVRLENLPLTPSGKVDKRSLPEPEIDYTHSFLAPRNALEETMAALWSEVLGMEKEKISVGDNFFQLGGNSLKAAVLLSKIHKTFEVHLSLTEIFKTPSIREITHHINRGVKETYISIEAVEEKEYYELSSVQKRLYVLQQMNVESTAYNITVMIPLPEEVDITKLEGAFQTLITRHENLRTSFHTVNGLLIQRIHDEVEFRINHFLTEFTEDTEGKGRELSHFIRYFDLAKAPLMRVGLFGNEGGARVLLVDMHHLITDGTSQEILKQDFMKLYHGEELPLLRIQYKDFVEWQRNDKEKGELEKQEVYWLNEFEGEIPVLNIPTDYPRPAVQSMEGNSINFQIDHETAQRLMAFIRKEEVTLNMLLLAGVNILLSKLSGQEDIVIGTPVAGRRHADLEKVIGMFVNTLALRNYPVGERRVEEFLDELKEKTLNAFDNQEYPFEALVEQVVTHRDLGRNPLFDVMLVLQNMNRLEIDGFGNREGEDETVSNPTLFPEGYGPFNAVSKFDLTIMVWEKKENLQLALRYCTKLFKQETIQRFIAYFCQLLSNIVETPRIKINELEVISEGEKKQILNAFNDTGSGYAKDKTFHQLVEAQAERMPDRVIVIGGDETIIQITYRELSQRSGAIAALLKLKNITAGSLIGIMVRPSLEMVAGIMGILKMGGAFLPIDPEFPTERIGYILNDSRMPILLTQSHLKNDFNPKIQAIHLDDPDLYKGQFPDIGNAGSPVDPAYVIYTSGTTGRPKGVLVKHQNVVNYIHWFAIHLQEDDKAILTSSFAFDALYAQFFSSLWIGISLHVIPRETFLIAEKLLHYLRAHCITYFKVTPSLFNLMVNSMEFSPENLKGLRFMMLGGEEINANDVEKAHHLCPNLRIMNHYGPTETTIASIARFLDWDQFDDFKNAPTIGKPINNTQVYILDRNLHIVPVGVVGEIWIGGDGVGMGYLNNPQLTSDTFITGLGGRRTRVYATGDLGRWGADGHIVFLGRTDDQIKIRGYRIELGEIENHLLTYPDIKEAIVLVREKKNREKYLCAYVIAETSIEISELRQYLSRSLPAAMIPSSFIQLEKMPLTKHNKLNREALPEPEFNTEDNHVAPRDAIERTLVRIWSEVLNLSEDKIGIDDHFFELGGHSLKATVMVSRIHKALDVQVPLADIFKRSTIRELAQLIPISPRKEFTDLTTTEEKDFYELSFNQKRLWFIQQTRSDSSAFHMSGRIQLEHEVNEEWIEKTLTQLLQRHESFRTGFKTIDGQPVQYILKELQTLPLKKINCSSMGEAEKQKQREQAYHQLVTEPFDLTQPPLFRAVLLELDTPIYEFMFNMHHIITDGWSMEIIKKEFQALYDGYRLGKEVILEPLTFRYRDFSEWQHAQLNDLKKGESYRFWKTKFQGGIPEFTLPGDFTGGRDNREGAGYLCVIDPDTTQKLKQLAQDHHTSLFTVMFSIYMVVLSRFSGEENIVSSIIGFGRPHASLHAIVGFFVNSLIYHTRVAFQEPFIDFLNRVNQDILDMFEHQDYPLEPVFKELKIKYPDLSVSFNMLNLGERSVSQGSRKITFGHSEKRQDVKFDLEVYVDEHQDGISLRWVYKKSLFDPAKIETIAEEYMRLIDFFKDHFDKSFFQYKTQKKKRNFKRSDE
ncbi:MAG: amino acid adenylation domain-containing protein [Candidatus Omnitrophota bacterium]